MKTCTKCQEEKPEADFYITKSNGKLHARCKSCDYAANKEWKLRNRSKVLEKDARYRDRNRDQILAYQRAYHAADPSRYSETRAQWYTNNKERVMARVSERAASDPEFKIRRLLRSRFGKFMDGSCGSRSKQMMELLGCSLLEFRQYIASKFKNGMSWENHGLYTWHVDHIKPCCSFDLTDPTQQRECFHYTNMQPLWAVDNRHKHGKTLGDQAYSI